MQSIGNKLQRTTSRAMWIALLPLFILGLVATSASAQSVVVSAPVSFYAGGAWPNGGALSGGNPAGSSWGMNSKGVIVASTTYGGDVIQFVNSATSGAPVYVESVAGPYGSGNAGPVAIDPSGNLWVGAQYGTAIVKVPMNSDGTYTVTDATASGATTPACTGTASDAAGECVAMKSANIGALGYYFGSSSLAFDSAGDLFIATNGQGSAPYQIVECAVGTPGTSSSCLYGTGAPTQIYQEPTMSVTTGSGTSNVQMVDGAMALDANGNLFFTDSAIVSASTSVSAYSELNEIPYGPSSTSCGCYLTGSEAAIATDTVPASIQTAVQNDNPPQSDDQIATVAIVPGTSGGNPTVYFGTTGETGGFAGGIFGITDNTGTTGNTTTGTPYTVAAARGNKLILPDGNGNFYVDAYNNADTLGFVAVGSVADPILTGAAQSTTFTANVADNGSAACNATTPPTLDLSVTGTQEKDFNASTTPPVAGTCASQLFGTTFPVTITFSPLSTGTDSATLTATDSSTTASGSATLSGTAAKEQELGITFDPATPTYASGLTIAVSAVDTLSNNSGNPITLTVTSGPATLDTTVPDQLDVTGAGSITVTANQAGSAQPCTGTCYAPALPTTKTVTVSPIAQLIVWGPAPPRNVVYSGTNVVLTLAATSATSTDSGQPVVFSVDANSTAGIAAVSGTDGSTLTISGTGTVIVDANEAASTNGDYAAAQELQATILVTATSQLPPAGENVVMSESTFLGQLDPAGGATAGTNPDGGTMAIDSNGNVIIGTTYGAKVDSFNPTSTTNPTVLTADGQDPSAVAVDPSGNLFLGNTYGYYVVKLPYNSTTGYAAYNPSGSPYCTGTDTAICQMHNVGVYVSGTLTDEPIQSMVFDSAGDLFYAIDQNEAGLSGIIAPGSIWECSAACLYSSTGSPAPVMLWQEPTGVTYNSYPVTQFLGGLAVDSAGDLFFTDSAENEGTSTNPQYNYIYYSDLYELPFTSGSYAGSATTLLTETSYPAAQYPAELDGVAIDPTNPNYVYVTDQAATYEFANTPGTPLTASGVQSTMWTISGQGGKYIAANNGTIYEADYSNAFSSYGDSMFMLNVGSVTVPGTVQDGTSATVPSATSFINSNTAYPINAMYTVLNDGSTCTTPPTVSFSDSSSDTIFTAALALPVAPATTTCSATITNAAWWPTVLTFAPPTGTASGAVTETLTASDSANTGTATVSGTAQNLIPQTITFTNPSGTTSTSPDSVTYSPTLTLNLAATGGASGNAVTFAVVSGPATLESNGTTLQVTGAGAIVVSASQAGNTTYAAAPQAEAYISVTAASQTITFTSPGTPTNSVPYGAAAVTLAATGGASGNAVTFTIDSSSTGYVSSTQAAAGTLSGNKLTFAGLGTVVIDANQAASTNGDYAAATQVQVSFTVGVASQTITAAPSMASATWSPTLSVTITASASSGLPVTLTQTSGSAIATLTGNTLTPTGTAFGPVTVQATQSGNSDYSAAPVQNITVTINPIGQVATPAFSQPSGDLYTNGEAGSTVTVTISDGTPNAAIMYTENGGALTAYPTGGFQLTQSDTPYTFTASASEIGYTPSQQASVTYTVSNLAPNFTASASPSAVNLTPGSSAIIDITIAPNASFLGTVSFSCTGAPAGVSCAFSPATLTSTGTNDMTTVVTITDAASTSANRRGPNPFIPGGATFALALCFFGFRKRRSLLLGLMLLAGVFGVTQLTGCGSGGGVSSKGSTTTSMTVVATSTYNGTTITQTLPVTITIRQ